VLLDHLEKSSILRAELQAAEALLAKAATRPIRAKLRILRYVERETRLKKKRMYRSHTDLQREREKSVPPEEIDKRGR
jgi:hypothetical protein